MKSDLDALMAKRGLDAVVVAGGEEYSDVRDYMSNGASITGGYILKKYGAEPILVVNGMEIEEAKKSGYTCKTYGELGYYDLHKEHGIQKGTYLFWGKLLQFVGVHSGKIGIYGTDQINNTLDLINNLVELLPDYTFVGESGVTLFREAYLTKDAQEIARIKSVAERTNAVVAQVWDFISDHRADDTETVVKSDGSPLTVGDVKRFMRRALLDIGLEDTHTIFAPAREGAFPHSRGEETSVLKLGQPIVFDIFPRELGGGYYHDMTRTWCIGYAPEKVQKLYQDVLEAFEIAVETYALGKPTYHMQEAVLDSFETKGHPTTRTTSNPTEGYVHSLGHGVGLNIHESPSIHHQKKEDIFQVGNFITIEPGLYYPNDEMGMRIEDSFIITESGELVSITPFKKDLVLPLKG